MLEDYRPKRSSDFIKSNKLNKIKIDIRLIIIGRGINYDLMKNYIKQNKLENLLSY